MSEWIPLMDYAIRKGVSLSTLRRHIKANKIPYKVENGRYLLLDQDTPTPSQQGAGATSPSYENSEQTADVRELRLHLQKAQEEIAELKTLIAFYEERTPNSKLSS